LSGFGQFKVEDFFRLAENNVAHGGNCRERQWRARATVVAALTKDVAVRDGEVEDWRLEFSTRVTGNKVWHEA